MKLFKRGRRQAGYCTISEPVSDLAPEVISAIKQANTEYKATNNGKLIHSTFQDNNEFDAITEPITLTPTPSESSSHIPPSRNCNVSIIHPSTIKLNKACDRDGVQSKRVARTPPTLKGIHDVGKSSTKAPLQSSVRVTETLVAKGKSDCRTTSGTTKSFDVTTDAPTERTNLFILKGTSRIKKDSTEKFNPSDNVETDDLDETFDPEIISVHSDITEPTYQTFDATLSFEHKWKKLRQGRLKLTELLGSGEKSQVSIFDFVIDTLCHHPTTRNKRRS